MIPLVGGSGDPVAAGLVKNGWERIGFPVFQTDVQLYILDAGKVVAKELDQEGEVVGSGRPCIGELADLLLILEVKDQGLLFPKVGDDHRDLAKLCAGRVIPVGEILRPAFYHFPVGSGHFGINFMERAGIRLIQLKADQPVSGNIRCGLPHKDFVVIDLDPGVPGSGPGGGHTGLFRNFTHVEA